MDGFIIQVEAKPGQQVKKGDLLVRSEVPELMSRLTVLRAELAGLQAKYNAALSQRVQADILRQQIAHAQVAVDLAQQRLAEVEVRSPGDGTFVMADVQNMAGRFVQRGELLGSVMADGPATVRVVIPQANADKVRKGSRHVEVRAVDAPSRVIDAQVWREVPGATNQLPSMTLSLQGGGHIGLDPAADGDAKTLQKLFVLDLKLPDGVSMDKLGSRIYVRFEHAPEPIGLQWFAAARRLYVRTMNV